MTHRPVSITAGDGTVLEAAWSGPERATTVVVFCHPHPRHGGTMRAPFMVGVTRHLVAAGVSVFRFNFRGVGGSEGAWSGGVEEVDDVHAAVTAATAAHPHTPPALAGWSFGAATALRWQARERSTLDYIGIAPPVSSELTPALPRDLAPAHRSFILGDRDQFVTVEELQEYADSIGASVEVLQGSDHFFYFREDKVAGHMLRHLA